MHPTRPWPQGPHRPLPKTVAPFATESVVSYIARLAHANHIGVNHLRRYVAESANSRPRPDWLATASNQPEVVIRARLRGFTSEEASPGSRHSRPMCRLCLARKAIHQPVFCFLPPHITVCQRHQLWIGPPARSLDDQRNLRYRPPVLAAARTHVRLVRQHGQTDIHHAMHAARHFLIYWANSERSLDAPILDKSLDGYVAAYPDLLAITETLVSHREQVENRGTRSGIDWPTTLLRKINEHSGHRHADITPIEQWVDRQLVTRVSKPGSRPRAVG